MVIAEALRRHPRHVGLAGLIAGLLSSGSRVWPVLVAAVSVPLVGFLTGRNRPALLVGLLVLAGAVLGAERREAIDRAPIEALIGHPVTARGHVVRRERPTPHSHRFRVRVVEVTEGGRRSRKLNDLIQVRVSRREKLPEMPVGRQVQVAGVPAGLPDGVGQADYSQYLRRSGVHAVLRARSVAPLGMRDGAVALLDGVRRNAEDGVGAGLEPRLSALATGIVLGQDERISAGTVEDFQASGLAHLLAVSGQNVTLLAVLALPLFGAAGLGRRARLACVLGLIALYVPLTGAGPSIMRAGAMGAAATVAQLAGRPASRWYALLLACAFTLAIDPRAWLDAGWQLSFAAVVGIFCLGPELRRRLHRLPAPLAEGASLTVAATLATAPLLAFHFERLSLVSLLANLAALPVVAPIMWTGTLAGAVGQFSTDAAVLLNAFNGFCLAYLAAIASWSASLPGASVSLSIGSPLVLGFAYLILAAAVAIAVGARMRPALPRARPAPAIAAIAVIGAIAAWAAWGGGGEEERRSNRFVVSFLDVGQGDATLFQTPEGVAVLIDGGPPGAGVPSRLRRAGVRSLDAVVLTHPQEDHQGGLEEVIRELPVRLLLHGGGNERGHDRITALAHRRGTRVVTAHAGLALRVGRLRMKVLSPPRDGVSEDPNRRSVVVHASYGAVDALLTGDAESDVTASLPLPEVELLKVAHHGSEDSGLEAMLERTRPEVAVIEVGSLNRYGHPHADTVATLARSVPTVRRTDRDGDVTVSRDEHDLTVTTER